MAGKPAAKQSARKRELKTGTYKSFKLQPRIKHTGPALPRVSVLARESFSTLLAHKRLFGSILGVFALLYVVFVRGFAGSDLTIVKDALSNSGQTLTAGTTATTGFGLFVYLLGSSTSAQSEVASLYQWLLIVVASLALIWALREVKTPAKKNLTMRAAYYKGNAQFVPFLLVLVVMGLQLIPALIGTTLYQQVRIGGLAVGALENFVWLLLLLSALLLSGFLLTSSLMALYIVTLPEVTPMQALQNARKLVLHRRWEVGRKILFLPCLLLLVGVVLFVPLLLVATTLGEVLFFVFGVFCLAYTHSYLYHLYRGLIK